MKIHEVICKRWLLPGFIAITLYPYIFYKGNPTQDTRAHEWAHVRQIQRIGWFKFYPQYLWYWIRYGTKNNPFELEAHEAEKHNIPLENTRRKNLYD